MERQVFALRVDPIWRGALLLLGVTPKRAEVALEEDGLRIRFGLYEERVPLAEVEGAEPIQWPWYYGIGLRVGAGALGYVGAYHGVVRVRFRAPVSLAVLFRVRMGFRAVALSLREPEAFVDALQARLSG